MKVYKSCCKNCLLTPDRIVSASRAKGIIQDCVKQQSYFTCHKASIEGDDIMCHSYYKKFGHHSQKLRFFERLGGVHFVEQPDSEKLIPYKDMNP